MTRTATPFERVALRFDVAKIEMTGIKKRTVSPPLSRLLEHFFQIF
jgi:hypothetical protein